MYVQVGELFQEVVIEHVNSRRQGRSIIVYLRKHCGPFSDDNCACHIVDRGNPFGRANHKVNSVSDAFAKAAQYARQAGTPILNTVLAPENLLPLGRNAFACALAITDDADHLTKSVEEVSALRSNMLKEALMAQLQKGPEGIKLWNASPNGELLVAGIDLEKYSFKDKDLTGIQLSGQDAAEANFENATLTDATFTGTNLAKTNFRKSMLDGANFSRATANNSDFSGASMKKIFSFEGSFKKCKFRDVDMSDSKLEKCDLSGADFTDAKLNHFFLQHCSVDEKTVFPPSFTNFTGLVWKGTGTNPYVDVAALSASAHCDNLDEFIDYLHDNLDESRMHKATAMLKKDRFQLFCEVSDEAIHGVVRSQTDADLVYSCSLNAKGHFCCCSQNLKLCGGLSGALCKHLLVLLIGMAKVGSIDYSRTALWCVASKAERPKLDKPAMTAVFLKYKGAQAGEIDWRPTETIPEDYYSY